MTVRERIGKIISKLKPRKHPKSYYGLFSFFFQAKLLWLFIAYILGLLVLSSVFVNFINIKYAGTPDISIGIRHKYYFILNTFLSPGFTEFIPSDDTSRLYTIIIGAVGIFYNAFYLSMLIARALQPRKPFIIVPFLLYHPEKGNLIVRLYSTLPANAYNLRFRFFRFSIYDNKDTGEQMGKTIEIETTPDERNLLLPKYGLLIRVKIEDHLNAYKATHIKGHKRKMCPREWLIPHIDDHAYSHFNFTVEAETPNGKVFQNQEFYLDKNNIKCGSHILLNHGMKLNLSTWYNWRIYNWKDWGNYNKLAKTIVGSYPDDQILNEYYDE